MPVLPMAFGTLVGLACERIRLLSAAPRRVCPTHPMADGGDVSAWSRTLGVGCAPPPDLAQLYQTPIATEPHPPDDVTLMACRRMVSGGLLERATGTATTYRPRARRVAT